MNDFDQWVAGWLEYDPAVMREKFEAKPSRIERALEISPSEHIVFVWEWESAAKACDLEMLTQVAEKWAPRAVELVMEHGKKEK